MQGKFEWPTAATGLRDLNTRAIAHFARRNQ